MQCRRPAAGQGETVHMRVTTLTLASLLLVGNLLCGSAWAVGGDGAKDVHATPLHAHATPGHAHGSGESPADPCDLTRALGAPPFSMGAPQPGLPVVVPPADAAFAALVSLAPSFCSSQSFVPITPVQQRVVLRI